MANSSITVSIKIRPLIKREFGSKKLWRAEDDCIISVDNQYDPLLFDNIFDENSDTKTVFNKAVKPIIDATLTGINGTVFAYGQTSSGKTYTMMGSPENPGIIPLAIDEIFSGIDAINRDFLVRCSYLEIYNEKIFDLLDATSKLDLKIHESLSGDILTNCTEHICTTPAQISAHMAVGNQNRKIGETNMNERSSRSHTIFKIIIENRDADGSDSEVRISALNLVDLAGSERADQTGASGSRLKEGAHINKSLLSLSLVIQKLSEEESAKFINYRDSKLTRILQASLGGNACTTIICAITPVALEETYSTLCFASRAKKIKNKPKVNQIISDAAMITRLMKEIKKLQNQLQEQNHTKDELEALKQKIQYREHQILHPKECFTAKDRRRTWAPSSAVEKPISFDSFLVPTAPSSYLAVSSDSNFINFTRGTKSNSPIANNSFLNESEMFIPGEQAFLSENRISPTIERINNDNEVQVHTPPSFKLKNNLLTPEIMRCGKQVQISRCHNCTFVEQELQELRDFTKLEFKIDNGEVGWDLLVKRESQKAIDQMNEYKDYYQVTQAKCIDYKSKLDAMNETVKALELENGLLKDEAMNAVKLQKEQEGIAVSAQYEFEIFRTKAKKREKELIDCLDDVRNGKENQIEEKLRAEIKKLEEEIINLSKSIEEEKTDKTGNISLIRSEMEETFKNQEIELNELKGLINNLRNYITKNDEEKNHLTTFYKQVCDAMEKDIHDILAHQSEIKSFAEILSNNLKTESSVDFDCTKFIDETLANITNSTQIIKISDFSMNETLTIPEVLVTDHEDQALIVELNNKIQLLESEVQVKSNNDKKNEDLIKNLKAKNEIISKENLKLQSEYDELSSQVMDGLQDSDNFKTVKEDLENQIKRQEEVISDLNIKIESSNREREDFIEKIQFLEDENKTQSQLIEAMELDSVDVIKSENERLMEKQNVLDAQIEELIEKQFKYEADERDNLLREKTDEENQFQLIEELEKTINSLQEQLRDALVERDSFESKITENEEQKYLMESKIQSLESLLANNSQLDEILIQNKDLEMKVVELLSEAQEFEVRAKEDLNNLETQLESEISKVLHFESENSQLKQTKDEFEVQAKEDLNNLETQLESQILKAQDFETENSQLKRTKEELEHRLKEFVNNNKNVVDQKNEMELRVKELETEQSKLKENDKVETIIKEKEVLEQKLIELTQKNTDLKIKINELESEHLKSTVDGFLKKIKELNEMNSSLSDNTVLLEAKIAELKTTKKNYESNIEMLESTISEHKKEMNQLSDLKTEILNLQEKQVEKMNNLEIQIRQHEEEKMVYFNEKSDLELKIVELEDQIKFDKQIAEQEILKLRGEIINNVPDSSEYTTVSKLESKIETLNEEINRLMKTCTENSLLQEVIQELNQNIEHLQNKIEEQYKIQVSIEEERETYKYCVVRLEQEYKEANEKVVLLEKQKLEDADKKIEIEKSLEVLKKEKLFFEETADNYKTEINNLLIKIEKRTENHKNEIQQFKETNLLLESEITNLSSELTIATSKLSDFDSLKKFEMENASQKFSGILEQHIAPLNDQIQSLLDENNNLKINCEELPVITEKYNSLKLKLDKSILNLQQKSQEMSEMITENKKSIKQIEMLQSTIISLKEINEALKDETEKLTKEKDEISSQFDQFKKSDLQSLKDETLKLIKEKNLISSQYYELKDETENLIKEKDAISSQFDQLKNEIQKLIKEKSEMTSQFDQLKNEIQKLIKEKNDMTSQLDQFKKSLQDETSKLMKEKSEISSQFDQFKKSHGSDFEKLTNQLKKKEEELIVVSGKLIALETELKQVKSMEILTNKDREEKIKELRIKVNQLDKEKDNSFRRENEQLKSKNEKLVMELNDARRTSNKDRKSRRQSTHDESRFNSLYSEDIGIQTDPTDKNCSCEEMSIKLAEFKSKNFVQQCHINQMIKKSKMNPFVDENNMLKKSLSEEERSRLKVSNELSELKVKFKEATKPKACPSCVFRDKKSFTSTTCQTDCNDLEIIERLKKLLYSETNELTEMKEKYKTLKMKENSGNNANNVSRNDAEIISLKKQCNEIFEKYNKLKVAYQIKHEDQKPSICQSIQTDPIESDVELIERLTNENILISNKYEVTKSVAVRRRARIVDLEAKLKGEE